MIQSIAVFVKKSGILVACRSHPQPDGAIWICALCDAAIIRASFGVLNGLWRCSCGNDVELLVNGVPVDLEAEQRKTFAEMQSQNVPAKPKRKRQRKLSDEDFLRECGITIKENSDMLDARIVINVSDQEHLHMNGLAGTFIVPAKKPGEEFGLLAIYNAHEIQDVGNQAKTEHWPSSVSIALDVLGKNSDAAAHTPGAPAGAEKWGLLLCEAAPDIPKDLLEAIDKERAFLNDNPPEIKQRRDRKTRMMLATTVDPPEIAEEKEKLAKQVTRLRAKFTEDCRKLVTKAEITRAKQHLQTEDQRLVSEGDTMWAGNEQAKRNISELHKKACIRLGQDRPWCYTAKQLVDCPGCGAKISENILTCPACAGWLDEGIEELRAMKPKDRALKMYPERYGEPVGTKAATR